MVEHNVEAFIINFVKVLKASNAFLLLLNS